MTPIKWNDKGEAVSWTNRHGQFMAGIIVGRSDGKLVVHDMYRHEFEIEEADARPSIRLLVTPTGIKWEAAR